METKTIIFDKIRKYYLKGLTAKEISKLLDISARTVQRYITKGDYNKLNTIKSIEQTAIELHEKGFSYAEIAVKLGVCKTTVYNWHKKAKTSQ